MEDRHHLSEPRAVSDSAAGLPTWEVDILRNGVDTPIMTMIINGETLPPRRRKKRVVWKLPDSLEHTPKFGVEDKKRIFEMYKQLKKERRRKSVNAEENNGKDIEKSNGFDGGGDSVNSLSNHGDPAPEAVPPPADPAREAVQQAADPRARHGSSTNGGNVIDIGKVMNGGTAANVGKLPKNGGTKHTEAIGKQHQQLQPAGIYERLPSADISTDDGNEVETDQTIKMPPEPRLPISPPPPGFGMGKLSLDSQPAPPPGQPPLVKPLLNGSLSEQNGLGSNNISSTSPLQPQTVPMQTSGSLLNTAPPPFLNGDAPPLEQRRPSMKAAPPDFRTRISAPPPGMPPQKLPLPSAGSPLRQFLVPVGASLASTVTESYFMMLSRAQVFELAEHYVLNAQKSITVGGAHAVCKEPGDLLLQLKSLAGSVVSIKGTLTQPVPESAESSVLVITTGTCLHPHALPFCHSLVLTQTFEGNNSNGNVGLVHGYQIQNDALCFLTPNDV